MEAKKHTRINENEWSFQRSNTSSNQNHNCFKKIINLALVATASSHQLELFLKIPNLTTKKWDLEAA